MSLLDSIAAAAFNRAKLALKTALPAEYFGVREGVDVYRALQTAIDECSALGVTLILPPYQMLISQPLVGLGKRHMISGYPETTKIKATDSGFDVLTLGPGYPGTDICPTGKIQYVELVGAAGDAPTDGSHGLVIDGLKNFNVENVRAGKTEVGFLIKGNSYGLKMTDCRTLFGECNVGLLLPGKVEDVFGSGSDLTFINNWLGGKAAAVWAEKDSGGYHFIGGQLSGGHGLTADDDTIGTVVLGVDYATRSIKGGIGNVDFRGIDFEGMKRGWIFRGYGRVVMEVEKSSFLATDQTNLQMGVLKFNDAENSQISFKSNTVDGSYSQAKLVQFAGANGGALAFHERGTLAGYSLKANGVALSAGTTLSQQSDLDIGVAMGRRSFNPFVSIGRMVIRKNGTAQPQISFDHGTNYFSLPICRTGAGAPTIKANYVGEEYFDTTNKVWYKSISTGTGAVDWQQITYVAPETPAT